jgi:hypothetical protein
MGKDDLQPSEKSEGGKAFCLIIITPSEADPPVRNGLFSNDIYFLAADLWLSPSVSNLCLRNSVGQRISPHDQQRLLKQNKSTSILTSGSTLPQININVNIYCSSKVNPN